MKLMSAVLFLPLIVGGVDLPAPPDYCEEVREILLGSVEEGLFTLEQVQPMIERCEATK
mgnify:CR=1 FL=1